MNTIQSLWNGHRKLGSVLVLEECREVFRILRSVEKMSRVL